MSFKYNITMSVWSLNYKQLALIDVENYYNNDKVNIKYNFKIT